MHWLYLAIAVVFEVAVGIAAGKAQGFRNIPWTIATLISGAIATLFLSFALLTFGVGVGYALWTSLAGVGIVIFGALFLKQRLTWKKLLGIAIVIVGVVGLNLAGTA
ncbi:MAG: SMR family transporter [Pseudoclavibacter sp.]|nr:SMR family transporter [Pseudoclavibacter sp.]